MKFDADVLRWRFLFAGFFVLFFLIGFFRFAYQKTVNFIESRKPAPWELQGKFPPGSLGDQIQDAQRRAKNAK